mgnify:FL=1
MYQLHQLEKLAKQGWTIIIVFKDGFYIDIGKDNNNCSAFHPQSLSIAITCLLSKIPLSEIPPEK